MEFIDGYYRLDQNDHNFCECEKSLQECKNDLIDVNKIKEERTILLKDIYSYLGIQNFLRITKILSSCVYSYFPNEEKVEECKKYDIHHCAECWEKVIREMKV